MDELLQWLIQNPDVIAQLVGAAGTIGAALIVGVAGTFITRRFQKERDLQDRESQWRSHAVELSRLELERKLGLLELDRELGKLSADYERPQQSILDFLACYRDLQELGEKSPRELYQDIQRDRIRPPASGESAKVVEGSGVSMGVPEAVRPTTADQHTAS
ncbi:MAG: hypothetical protein WD627_03500 [Actinomycetota bacterium]